MLVAPTCCRQTCVAHISVIRAVFISLLFIRNKGTGTSCIAILAAPEAAARGRRRKTRGGKRARASRLPRWFVLTWHPFQPPPQISYAVARDNLFRRALWTSFNPEQTFLFFFFLQGSMDTSRSERFWMHEKDKFKRTLVGHRRKSEQSSAQYFNQS